MWVIFLLFSPFPQHTNCEYVRIRRDTKPHDATSHSLLRVSLAAKPGTQASPSTRAKLCCPFAFFNAFLDALPPVRSEYTTWLLFASSQKFCRFALRERVLFLSQKFRSIATHEREEKKIPIDRSIATPFVYKTRINPEVRRHIFFIFFSDRSIDRKFDKLKKNNKIQTSDRKNW